MLCQVASKLPPRPLKIATWAQLGPILASSWLPRGPQDAPKRTQDGSKRLQEGPKRPQEAPRRAQGGPKTAPRRPQVASRSLPSRIQKSSYIKKPPKKRPRGPKNPQKAPKRPRAPRRPPRGAQEPPKKRAVQCLSWEDIELAAGESSSKKTTPC